MERLSAMNDDEALKEMLLHDITRWEDYLTDERAYLRDSIFGHEIPHSSKNALVRQILISLDGYQHAIRNLENFENEEPASTSNTP